MSSYSQIFRSTSIVGGAQGVALVIGLIRIKVVAVLLGPTGIGLIGLYQAAIGLVATISGLGISSSGVRQVAQANGTGDQACVARTVLVLRRICWFTGLLGTILALVPWLGR